MLAFLRTSALCVQRSASGRPAQKCWPSLPTTRTKRRVWRASLGSNQAPGQHTAGPHEAQAIAAELPSSQQATSAGLLQLPQLQPELAAIATVYFVQGILELSYLAQTFFLKDELHADPAQVGLYMSLAALPWCIKPLIGFVSDTVPLFGYKRRSYLMLASVAGAASYAAMAGGSRMGPGAATAFMGAMLMASAASAVSDVVVDSMVVERARGESAETSGSLQSLCWGAYAVAQIFTASLSGSLVQDYGPRFVFEVTAFFPLLVGAAALLVPEERITPGAGRSSSTSSSSHSSEGTHQHQHPLLPHHHHSSSGGSVTTTAMQAEGHCHGHDHTHGHSSSSSSGAQAGHMHEVHAPASHAAATAAAAGASAGVAAQHGQAHASSATAHAKELWDALRRPDVLAPLGFLLLLSATPTADPAMFYFQTETLGFTPAFLGQVQLAAALASFAGVMVYNSWLKQVPVRRLMLVGTLLAATLQSGQLVLVSGLHRQFGIDDHVFVLGGSLVMDVVQQILSMPMFVLAARMCPTGLEASMFATLMSILNLADGVRMGGGAAIMHGLGITAEDMTNLPTLLAICNASLLVPLTLLGNIPAKFDSSEPETSEGEEGVATAAAATAAAGTTAATTQEQRELEHGQHTKARPAPLAVPGASASSHASPAHASPAGSRRVSSAGSTPRTPREALVDALSGGLPVASMLGVDGGHASFHHFHTHLLISSKAAAHAAMASMDAGEAGHAHGRGHGHGQQEALAGAVVPPGLQEHLGGPSSEAVWEQALLASRRLAAEVAEKQAADASGSTVVAAVTASAALDVVAGAGAAPEGSGGDVGREAEVVRGKSPQPVLPATVPLTSRTANNIVRAAGLGVGLGGMLSPSQSPSPSPRSSNSGSGSSSSSSNSGGGGGRN